MTLLLVHCDCYFGVGRRAEHTRYMRFGVSVRMEPDSERASGPCSLLLEVYWIIITLLGSATIFLPSFLRCISSTPYSAYSIKQPGSRGSPLLFLEFVMQIDNARLQSTVVSST